jgi:hypothetical protein
VPVLAWFIREVPLRESNAPAAASTPEDEAEVAMADAAPAR